MAKKKVTHSTAHYRFSFTTLGQEYVGEGGTALEALNACPAEKIRTKGNYVVVKTLPDGTSKSHTSLIAIRKVLQLFKEGDSFSKKVCREQFAKWLELCLS